MLSRMIHKTLHVVPEPKRLFVRYLSPGSL